MRGQAMKRTGIILILIVLAFTILTWMLWVMPALASTDSEQNHPDYWCEPEMGIKYEPVATPFVVPEPPEGTTWTLGVVKAGTTNETVAYPKAGDLLSHSLHENSHVILCWETAVVTTTSSTTTTHPTTTTSSTKPSTTTTSTTTTAPTSTTSSSTTTTEATTTTSIPSSTSTSTPVVSTTTPTPPTTVPASTTTLPTLPKTGSDLVPIGIGAALLLTLGAATIYGSRKKGQK